MPAGEHGREQLLHRPALADDRFLQLGQDRFARRPDPVECRGR